MKRATRGMTIIEVLIGITFLAVIMGSILGTFIVVQRHFKDGIAMAKSQATARIVIERMVRPIRHGESFSVSSNGNTLTLTEYGGLVDIFSFEDNKIKQNGNTIGINIYEIPGENIFQNSSDDELIGINFAVKNQGMLDQDKEIRISTEMKLRN